MEEAKQKLIDANQLRLKFTKVDILVKQALKLRGFEKNQVLNRALAIVKSIQKALDDQIKKYLAQYQVQLQKEDQASFSETSSKLKIKGKLIVAELEKEPERDIFSENPFESFVNSNAKSDSLMNVRQNQTNNLLNLAQKVQSLLSGENLSNNITSEASNVADMLLTQVFKSKAMLELVQTQEEVKISDDEFICIVHKGVIRGGAYICPHCRALYCFKCANALKQQGETCWSCHHDYYIDLL
ncbi:MAG: hypothetical protein ACTSR8_16900 [Promethearchaeota archaeon]